MKKIAFAAAAACLLTAAPALAGPTITSIQIQNIDGIAGQGYLQIAELQLFGGATNYALTGTATATSVYANGSATADRVNDNDTSGVYPDIYHGDANDGSDILTLTLAQATAIDRVSIFGRTDSCCTFRDIYSYTLFNGATAVGTGTLDARQGSFATAAVPEPATWAMMLVGFGMIGFGMRYRRKNATAKVSFA